MAGTTCGAQYGVSSNCQLCSVKALDADGSGTLATVIAGINHVLSKCSVPGSALCVANMSLGGPKSNALNTAVAAAVNGGMSWLRLQVMRALMPVSPLLLLSHWQSLLVQPPYQIASPGSAIMDHVLTFMHQDLTSHHQLELLQMLLQPIVEQAWPAHVSTYL